jgi:hypothetical protein
MRGRAQGKPQRLQVKAATDNFWMPLMPLAVGVVVIYQGGCFASSYRCTGEKPAQTTNMGKKLSQGQIRSLH